MIMSTALHMMKNSGGVISNWKCLKEFSELFQGVQLNYLGIEDFYNSSTSVISKVFWKGNRNSIDGKA